MWCLTVSVHNSTTPRYTSSQWWLQFCEPRTYSRSHQLSMYVIQYPKRWMMYRASSKKRDDIPPSLNFRVAFDRTSSISFKKSSSLTSPFLCSSIYALILIFYSEQSPLSVPVPYHLKHFFCPTFMISSTATEPQSLRAVTEWRFRTLPRPQRAVRLGNKK